MRFFLHFIWHANSSLLIYKKSPNQQIVLFVVLYQDFLIMLLIKKCEQNCWTLIYVKTKDIALII